MIITNYWVDPGNLFRNGNYANGIVRILLEGKNVAGVGNYDDRLLQKIYINGLQSKNEVIVLGSSRSMHIRSGLFPEKTFFNNSVSKATLRDAIAIYGMYRKRGLIPQKVIVCLDDWILEDSNELDHWRSIDDEYYSALQMFMPGRERESLIGAYRYKLHNYLQLLSPGYFHTAIFDLLKGNSYKYFATEKISDDTAGTKLFDGSLNYKNAVRNRDIVQVRAIALAADVSKGQNLYNPSPHIVETFEYFITQIISDGVKVVFFLPPYHPKYFERLVQATDRLNKVERYMRIFADNKKINVFGSYNPLKAGCSEEDFYDEGHLRDSGIHKIFRQDRSVSLSPTANQTIAGFR